MTNYFYILIIIIIIINSKFILANDDVNWWDKYWGWIQYETLFSTSTDWGQIFCVSLDFSSDYIFILK